MSPDDNPRTQPRLPLSRERVLDAAIRLADEGGIESLTMRKLARELGVEAMSLYNHVKNKGDLVNGIVDIVFAEVELPETGKWDEAIRRCAISAHVAFRRHPWACSLMMSPNMTPGVRAPRLLYMEWLLRRLREAGFSPDLTYHAYHALDSHILGFTLWQLAHSVAADTLRGERDLGDIAADFLRRLPATDYPYLAEHVEQHLAAPAGDGARQFEFGLDLILESLERARGGAGPSGPTA
jgi:AcrR family transcriptional regulator